MSDEDKDTYCFCECHDRMHCVACTGKDLLAAAKAAHDYLRNVLLTENKPLVNQLTAAITKCEKGE